MLRIVFPVVLILLAAVSPQVPAQQAEVDWNTYYRFPLSIGLEYHSLRPLSNYNSDYSIFEVSGELRYPIPPIPVLQPFFRGGIIKYDSLDLLFPEKWDHTHAYGALGLAYVYRFVKNFEVGAELLAGFSGAVFPNAVDTGSVSSAYTLFGAGGKISLIPSYSVAIEVQPSLRYMLSLSPLNTFDGLLFGLGFSVHFRFGEDPDSASALIRSLRFDQVSVPALYAAMQSFYAKNPIGSVSLTNTERSPVTEVQVGFYQQEFMDSVTVAADLPEIEPGQTVQVPLLASFNQTVFSTEGITPLTGEIVVTYKSRGRAVEQRQSVSYDLYDKTAITWDDDRKVGAFITPADSALRNYSSFVRQSLKEQTAPRFNEPLQVAMQIYSALAEIGTIYQTDPSSPFTEVQENILLVDSISLPRDTLKRITGDCDDLTVLFCSLLETVGIETGYITVPGHIYPVFNSGVESRDFRELHPSRELTLAVDGQLWMPVEITLVGRNDFLEAWRRGAELWNSYESEPTKRGFYRTREAQAVFRPVGLRETDLGLQYGNASAIAETFTRDLTRLSDLIVSDYATLAKQSGSKTAYNKLGLAYARFARYQEAGTAFSKALQSDPAYFGAMVNLGNVRYLSSDYDGALRLYENARSILSERGLGDSSTAQMILLNISQTFHALQNFEKAGDFFAQAESIDPEQVREYAFLSRDSSGTSRAADAGADRNVLFLDE